MPRAAFFSAPDLTTNGVLAKATAQNGWTGSAPKQAQDWYNNFLEAVYAANGTPIGVMNRKADDLWHVHKDDPSYDAYCISCFGYVVQHIESPPRRKATAAELDAVKPYYKKWPIPDSITSCHT
jgi:hypothetical protein